MKHVVFLKAGNPYGYGYSAGETGLVRPASEIKTNPKTEKETVISWGYDKLSDAGIVRLATKAETEAYEAVVKAQADKKAAKTAASKPTPPATA